MGRQRKKERRTDLVVQLLHLSNRSKKSVVVGRSGR